MTSKNPWEKEFCQMIMEIGLEVVVTGAPPRSAPRVPPAVFERLGYPGPLVPRQRKKEEAQTSLQV